MNSDGLTGGGFLYWHGENGEASAEGDDRTRNKVAHFFRMGAQSLHVLSGRGSKCGDRSPVLAGN